MRYIRQTNLVPRVAPLHVPGEERPWERGRSELYVLLSLKESKEPRQQYRLDSCKFSNLNMKVETHQPFFFRSFVFFQEGESNLEEIQNEGKTSSRIPPLTESFVKETKIESSEEQCQTSTSEIVQESSSINELKVNGEESDSLNTSAHDTNTAKSANHENNTLTDSHDTKGTKNGDDMKGTDNENTELSGQMAKRVNPHVKQDFSAINVGVEYTGEDIRPLEDNSGDEEDVISVESESGDESESGENELENGDEGDSDGDVEDEGEEDIRAAYGKHESE